jgi:hypothetical protein
MRSSRLNVFLACLFALMVNAAAGRAQTPPEHDQLGRFLAGRVPPSRLETNAPPDISVLLNLFPSWSTNAPMARFPKPHSSIDRREKFEAEFGLKERDPSLVKGSLEEAKYNLDATVFAAQEFIETFRYEGRLKDFVGGSDSNAPSRRYYSDPVRDAWENAEIKSGIDLDPRSGRPFVGVRLVLPLGD